MSDKTRIEWATSTWNPLTGCTKVSPGCDHCYAETFAERFRGTSGHYFERGFDVQLRPEKLDQPLRWRRPRRIFVNSMSDLFHDQVPDEYIARVFAVMSIAQQHTFQVLTKRHGRMRAMLTGKVSPAPGASMPFKFLVNVERMRMGYPALPDSRLPDGTYACPLPNVWLGVSVENQQWADIRIPALLETPAAVRFLSCEPLLGAVDLAQAAARWTPPHEHAAWNDDNTLPMSSVLHWVIVGGESGHGARPMHPDWARSLRDQCQAAGVPFLFKQWGEWVTVRTPSGEHQARVGKKAAGRELDGRTWDEYPEVAHAQA